MKDTLTVKLGRETMTAQGYIFKRKRNHMADCEEKNSSLKRISLRWYVVLEIK